MNPPLSRWRYAGWLGRDVLTGPFALFTIFAVLFAIAHALLFADTRVPANPAVLQARVLFVCLTVSCLIAAGGVAGNDNQRGWYRIWFSKPMSPTWYYLQRFLLGGLAVLWTPIIFGISLMLLEGHGTGLSWRLLAVVALGYLLIGGAVLFFSNFTGRDWLVVFLMSFGQQRVHEFAMVRDMIASAGPTPANISPVLLWLDRLLPPFHLIIPPFNMLASGVTIPRGAELTRLVGYGLGFVVLALLIMHRKPMGSGGRS